MVKDASSPLGCVVVSGIIGVLGIIIRWKTIVSGIENWAVYEWMFLFATTLGFGLVMGLVMLYIYVIIQGYIGDIVARTSPMARDLRRDRCPLCGVEKTIQKNYGKIDCQNCKQEIKLGYQFCPQCFSPAKEYD